MASIFVRVWKTLQTAVLTIDTERRVQFSPGFFFQLPRLKAQLFAGLVEGSDQGTELSLPDLRILFESIRSAYELQELREIKVGNMSWTTDCRFRPNAPERVSITFKIGLGRTHASMTRTQIATTLAEFEAKLMANL